MYELNEDTIIGPTKEWEKPILDFIKSGISVEDFIEQMYMRSIISNEGNETEYSVVGEGGNAWDNPWS